MSGYLQRLVAGVAQPQSRLRPLVGSVFATDPSTPREEAPTILIADAPAEGAAPLETPSVENAAPLAPPAPVREPVRSPRPSEGSHPTRLPAPLGQTALDRRAGPEAPPSRPKAEPMSPQASAPTVGSLPPRPSAEPWPDPAAPTEPTAAAATAKLPERLVTTDWSGRLESSIAAPRTPSRDAKPDPLPPAVHRSPAPARQVGTGSSGASEEPVQIHIGRIEVVAAAPARPAAAAAPRRSTSLADYLKRGERRPR
jgi:translation initiation factor IF-2